MARHVAADHPQIGGGDRRLVHRAPVADDDDAIGQRERARRILSWVRAQRTDNGAYWTGATHPEGIIFPDGEQTTWTAAAVIIALGFVCARLLRQTRPADAAARPDVAP